MNLKAYFEKIDLKEIESYIQEQKAEDLYLEFKTANCPQGLEFDKKNFSKGLSGFANSSGGILIWGILAKENKNKPDVANDLKPINNLIDFETYLKKNEGNAITPFIDGVEYKRVLIDESSGYLIVYIPQSDRAPHMAQFADKRSGDSFYICEHFDIMDMINRKISPSLTLSLTNLKVYKNKHQHKEYEIFEGILCIDNVSQTSAKYISLSINVIRSYTIATYGLDGNGNRGMKMTRRIHNSPSYNGGSDIVLHPGATHEVDKIVLNDSFSTYVDICDLTIEYTIVCENMNLKKDTLTITKEEIRKKTSA